MTSTLQEIETAEKEFPALTEEQIAFCDSQALKYLMLSPKVMEKTRRIIPRLQSVYYKEDSADGGALLVCIDESILFAASFVSRGSHLMAFENGLRTSPDLLLARKEVSVE